jgi:Na+/H+ antiporter NhaC
MPATAPDIFSLVPVLLALVISISLRNVIFGLFVGLFAGVLMIEGPALLGGMSLMVRDYLVPQVTDSYNAGVLVLLGFIGGFVALMERSGGGAAFAAKVARYITTKARLQISAWIGGIVIFFSDLGTPLIVGPTFRPMADHLRVSRAKLAYIIDSTASPVAILVPFIGWGVYIMSLLEQQFTALGIEQSDFQALVSALPFQFYAWLAVFAVPLLALTGVEFGPMARSERRAAESGLTPEEAASAALNAPAQGATDKARASFIWLPLLVLFVVLLWTLVPLGFPFGRVSGADFRAGLSTAYLSAAVALILLMAFVGAQRVMASVQVYLEGMSRMMLVAIMLLLAWAMGDMTTALGGDVYVATLAAENAAPWSCPPSPRVRPGAPLPSCCRWPCRLPWPSMRRCMCALALCFRAGCSAITARRSPRRRSCRPPARAAMPSNTSRRSCPMRWPTACCASGVMCLRGSRRRCGRWRC